MKREGLLAIAVGVLALAACSTVDGFMDDLGTATDGGIDMVSAFTGDHDDEAAIKCPQVQIVQDLGLLNEFTNNYQPSDGTLTSRARIELVENTCTHNQKSVTSTIKLAFHSSLGPKAKLLDGDKPFFTYPFFVAVAEPDGDLMAKEVYAASMSYKASEFEHTYYETIKPIIPISRKSKADRYAVLVGFQLTPEQYDYNRGQRKQAQTAPAVPASTNP